MDLCSNPAANWELPLLILWFSSWVSGVIPRDSQWEPDRLLWVVASVSSGGLVTLGSCLGTRPVWSSGVYVGLKEGQAGPALVLSLQFQFWFGSSQQFRAEVPSAAVAATSVVGHKEQQPLPVSSCPHPSTSHYSPLKISSCWATFVKQTIAPLCRDCEMLRFYHKKNWGLCRIAGRRRAD